MSLYQPGGLETFRENIYSFTRCDFGIGWFLFMNSTTVNMYTVFSCLFGDDSNCYHAIPSSAHKIAITSNVPKSSFWCVFQNSGLKQMNNYNVLHYSALYSLEPGVTTTVNNSHLHRGTRHSTLHTHHYILFTNCHSSTSWLQNQIGGDIFFKALLFVFFSIQTVQNK